MFFYVIVFLGSKYYPKHMPHIILYAFNVLYTIDEVSIQQKTTTDENTYSNKCQFKQEILKQSK